MQFKPGLIVITALILTVSAIAPCAGESFAQGGLGISYPQKAKMLEDALRMDPDNANTLIQLGNTYYDWGFHEANSRGRNAQPEVYWQKAIDYYGRALEKVPDDANVRTDRANLLRFTGKTDEAIEEYRTAKKSDPNHVQSRINLVKVLGDIKGEYKAAIKEYEELLEVVPGVANDMELKEDVERYRFMSEGKAPKDTGLPPMQQQQQQAPDYEFKF